MSHLIPHDVRVLKANTTYTYPTMNVISNKLTNINVTAGVINKMCIGHFYKLKKISIAKYIDTYFIIL